MWLNHKGGCGIKICTWVWHKVCRSDQVLIKGMGLGLWVWLFSSGCGWGAVFLEMWVLIAKEALSGFTVQGFFTKILNIKSGNGGGMSNAKLAPLTQWTLSRRWR